MSKQNSEQQPSSGKKNNSGTARTNPSAQRKLGIVALARPTFDVQYANEKHQSMLACLDKTGHIICGPTELLMDDEQVQAAIEQLQREQVEQLVLLQVTFTDSLGAQRLADEFTVPLSIWATPEPRTGDRLRLNAFCGMNLASHALGQNAKTFNWLYHDPDASDAQQAVAQLLDNALTPDVAEHDRKVAVTSADTVPGTFTDTATGSATSTSKAREVLDALQGKKIACIGKHPPGFSTCAYDRKKAGKLTGMEIDEITLSQLFSTAESVAPEDTASLQDSLKDTLSELDKVDQQQLQKSLALKVALDQLSDEQRYDAFAIRCWPETFTEYGGAVCGAVSMLGENRVPCACEADVYGAMTQLLLQQLSGEAVFLVDIVDMDAKDNTAVLWHCGQAPVSMCDEEQQPRATIHTNRKMPLLFEFALKPGRITLARITQSKNRTAMVISGANVIKRPMSFTGTSAVIEFDSGAEVAMHTLLDSGIEHHLALVYGEYQQELADIACAMELPAIML